MPYILHDGPAGAGHRLIIAHGAGTGIESPFMESMTALVVARGFAVTRFEFAYMAARRTGGPRRPAPKAELLIAEFDEIVRASLKSQPPAQTLIIGGKSLGGRVASLIADDAFRAGHVAGLICLGYPFHPPGQPEKRRTAHLEHLACPALIVQGVRDPFGNRTEIEALTLSPALQLHWIADGDHDFGPRGNSGLTRKGNLSAAADAVAAFAAGLEPRP